MAQQNGGGEAFATAGTVGASTHQVSSLDGFAGSAPEDPFAERPELLLGAAFLGGLLFAGLVSRFGR
jgi:hypothetical protein